MIEMLTKQVISLAWFRCLMEEGYDFVNKMTGEIETNEITIYRNFQANTGAFDMPAALCSPKGMQKNLYEVIGNLIIYNTNPAITDAVNSVEFKTVIQKHIEDIKNRKYSGKVPT